MFTAMLLSAHFLMGVGDLLTFSILSAASCSCALNSVCLTVCAVVEQQWVFLFFEVEKWIEEIHFVHKTSVNSLRVRLLDSLAKVLLKYLRDA